MPVCMNSENPVSSSGNGYTIMQVSLIITALIKLPRFDWFRAGKIVREDSKLKINSIFKSYIHIVATVQPMFLFIS